MGLCYGSLFDPVYEQAFMEVGNSIGREQAGSQYPYPFLEATTLDLMAQFTGSFRYPATPVLFPGHTEKLTPKNMTPPQWAQALLRSFMGLIVSYRNITTFTTFEFHRSRQDPFPTVLRSIKAQAGQPAGPGKVTPPPKGGQPARVQPKGGAQQVDPEAKEWHGLCANDIMIVYKLKLKSGDVLKPCEPTCNRMHVKDFDESVKRRQVVSVAHRFCKPVMDPVAFKAFLEVVAADKRYK
jgi:hypothetical protein